MRWPTLGQRARRVSDKLQCSETESRATSIDPPWCHAIPVPATVQRLMSTAISVHETRAAAKRGGELLDQSNLQPSPFGD